MLIRFEVENFRSINDPVSLSMVAIDQEREAARRMDRVGHSLVTRAGIYGPNASGKSNVLAAFAWLRRAVATSMRNWDEAIPVEPFAFGDGRDRDTSFALDMAVAGVRFEYLLDVNHSRVSYEALFHYPSGRRRRVFEREENDIVLQRGLGQLAGTRSVLTDRSLALSIMRRFGEPLTSSFITSLLESTVMGPVLGQGPRRWPMSSRATLQRFELVEDGQDEQTQPLFFDADSAGGEDRERAMALIRLADIGVSDVRVQKVPFRGADEQRAVISRRPQLVHSAAGEDVPFDYDRESEGTRAWFSMVGPLLDVLDRGSLALFDELDASLHPTLTAQVLRLFESPELNPHGAQLVFTSHDTSLLNHLNRDEVWLTQKRSDGSTELGALADFAGGSVRRSQNIERGYLSGRFGALPDVSSPSVLRALGLIG